MTGFGHRKGSLVFNDTVATSRRSSRVLVMEFPCSLQSNLLSASFLTLRCYKSSCRSISSASTSHTRSFVVGCTSGGQPGFTQRCNSPRSCLAILNLGRYHSHPLARGDDPQLDGKCLVVWFLVFFFLPSTWLTETFALGVQSGLPASGVETMPMETNGACGTWGINSVAIFH